MESKRWVSIQCTNPAVMSLEKLVEEHPRDYALLKHVQDIDEYIAERFADYERRIKELWDEKHVGLCDRFAMAALTGLCADPAVSIGGIGKLAYVAADSAMKARGEEEKK